MNHKGPRKTFPPGFVAHNQCFRSVAHKLFALKRNPLPAVLILVHLEPLRFIRPGEARYWFWDVGNRDEYMLVLGEKQRFNRAENAFFENRF